VGLNLAMDSSWGVPTIPKVLFKSVERFGRSRLGFGGVDPQVLFFPRSPGHTGLTGASHRSDRCRPLLGLLLGWTFECVRCCPVLLLFRVLVSLELGRPVWCFVAFWLRPVWLVCCTGLTGVEPFCGSRQVSPAGTGLTGGAHRSDRCWSMDLSFGVPLRSRVCEVGSWLLGSVALQWLRGLGQLG
jgi:hypothetical protein